MSERRWNFERILFIPKYIYSGNSLPLLSSGASCHLFPDYVGAAVANAMGRFESFHAPEGPIAAVIGGSRTIYSI